MLSTLHLLEKGRELCIKARQSPLASLAVIGRVTKHATVKWLIDNEMKQINSLLTNVSRDTVTT